MGKSYRDRLKLNGNLQEFIGMAGKMGIWDAMECFKLHDYLAARKLLKEETGDENYGINTNLNYSGPLGIRRILRELVVAVADYAIKNEEEKKELKSRLDSYKGMDKMMEIEITEEIKSLIGNLRSESADDS